MKMKKVTSLLAMTVAAVMAMTGCGGNDAADDSAGNKVYHIGIIQQMEHGSLDQATKGFTAAVIPAISKSWSRDL